MVGDAPQPGLLQPGLAGLADGLATASVLVVGGDVSDPGVQPHGVVVGTDHRELRAQGGGVADGEQVRVLGLDVTEQRLDPRLVGRGAGRPKCWWMAHNAMNSRVEPEVICGPLSLIASRIGRWSSSV